MLELNIMFIPKIVFKNISIKTEVDLIHQFLFENKCGWKKDIIKEHPKLKKIYSMKYRNARLSLLKKYIINFRKKTKK
jgi:hypothetical protein